MKNNLRSNTEAHRQQAVAFLEELFGEVGGHDVGVRLWDGTMWPDETPRRITLKLNHPGALSAMFRDGTELALAEAYMFNDFDIVGDIECVFGLSSALAAATAGWRKKLRAAMMLARMPQAAEHAPGRRGPAQLAGKPHSIERDRQAVAYHYNVSNAFYELWLDSNMVYSCAYFHTPEQDIDTAQEQKLDYICRKLQLRPGQRMLDIGCGWGGLALHAARYYGVDVTGITLSQPQADWATARILEAKLSKRVRVLVRDYREIQPVQAELYDALVSVGMFEHIGAANMPVYFSQALQLLKPCGVFLNHAIARRTNDLAVSGPSFTDAYVFPDGELTPISITLNVAEESGFEVRDVESLREHYTLTLRHWVRRLESRHNEALRIVDEPTYRVWRLYMAGAAHNFATWSVNVYQSLLVKPDHLGRTGLPLTRKDWYADDVTAV
ncbi:MAG: cyclopropane-fatty-acyl-phospholipid synthase [Planctomycetia bacterium]|nr:cyclopropane-fatty-acyl-phospholipid synthase [Planctomycetia bacterium]